jgi:hypothetical protein
VIFGSPIQATLLPVKTIVTPFPPVQLGQRTVPPVTLKEAWWK